MKKNIMILASLVCMSAFAVSAEDNNVIKPRGSIGEHLGEAAALIRTYGKPKQLLDSPSSVPATTEVMMWKVGEGILVIETSFSAGIIKNISYVITDSQNRRTTLKVKEFNPATGEMTIIIPNKVQEDTTHKVADPQH